MAYIGIGAPHIIMPVGTIKNAKPTGKFKKPKAANPKSGMANHTAMVKGKFA
jgi:hypothetical protein